MMYIETHPISSNLLPFDLLPRDRQLPPQPLELPFAQPPKPPIQLLLITLLHARDLPQHLGRQRRGAQRGGSLDPNLGDLFRRGQADVAVLVVMDVDVDGAAQGRGSA